MAMSKEEKAVRDALAKVLKDSAASDAAVKAMNTGTTSTKPATPKVPTGSNYGAFAESPLYQYNPLVQADQGTGDTKPKDEVKKDEVKQDTQDRDTQDAYAILKGALSAYGLESLYTTIEGYMKTGLGPEQAKLKIKQEPAYQARFAGNEKRRTAGLNVLSEAEYLSLEDTYNQTLRAYGQQGYFGTTASARQAAMANLIGNDISATEFKDRIDLAVTRVNNADPEIKNQLKAFYKIEDTDLVGYFLNPTQNLPKLEEKVKAAEIGSAAAAQNLKTSLATAEDLAKYGVDLQTARKGYATIADVLPTAEKLGSIYKEDQITYGQAEAEAETFKGLASAQRKRQQLAAKEIGTFSGQSGIARGALGTTGSF